MDIDGLLLKGANTESEIGVSSKLYREEKQEKKDRYLDELLLSPGELPRCF